MASAQKLIWKRKGDAEANAARALPAMASEYFAAGRKVLAKRPEPSELHVFRLKTKRFRYTLEVFVNLYGPSMKQHLALLKPVQDALGQVNDCVVTDQQFAGDEKFSGYLSRRAARKGGEFYRAWEQTFDAEGQEEMWLRYLSSCCAAREVIER
jgi:CHAD domain-containing protein